MTVKEFAVRQRLRTRSDEDSTDIVPGKVGYVYEYDDELLGVMVMPKGRQTQYWTYAKRALLQVGCLIVQNGDHEGAATFDPLASAQVKAALRAAGIHRIRVPAPPSVAQLESRQRFTRMKRAMTRKEALGDF